MLRPATPLTILLFGAFVLLLISVLSTPIISGIPLASFDGVTFGVFGYCQDGKGCSPIEVGYSTENLYTTTENASFRINVSTRSTLSSILIVHPIAAVLTLIMLILAFTAHFHSPSHSPRYLLGTFILSILTLLVSLLAFLVDLLLFLPYMGWGSYIVLAATIMIVASTVISCAMRRTLVSRKARKRRIAENAEMNGENYYNRQAAAPPPLAPVAVGALDANKLPAFATFESAKEGSERTSDDRMPLTTRTLSNKSAGERGETRDGSIPLQDRFAGPQQGPPNNGFNGPPQRDQYGNIIPAAPAYGRSRDQSQDSQYRNPYPGGPGGPYRGRGGPQGFRGRGGPGYPGPGRGGYGPPGGRGGYGPGPNRGPPGNMNGPMAGAAMGGMAAGAMMRGGRGGGPPGYGNGYPPNGQGRRAPSPGGSYGPYGRAPSDGPQIGAGFAGMPPPGEYAGYNGQPPHDDILPRAESPPPLPQENGMVGQAIEMDATTGSPSQPPGGFTQQFGGLRDGDSDVAGMVNLQQQKAQLSRNETVLSDTSHYSGDEPYVPARQAWNTGASNSPLNTNAAASHPSAMPVSPMSPSHQRQTSGDNYYEDVDPRFATELPDTTSSATASGPVSTHLPAALAIPIPQNHQQHHIAENDAYLHPQSNSHFHNGGELPSNGSYEDIASGSRSPAESERSTFTSVSQRGVNPRWNPGMGPGGPGGPQGPGGYGPPNGGGMRRGPPLQQQMQNQRNDMLLSSNPDFELPGMGARRGGGGGMGSGMPRGGRGGGGMVPRSAYDNGVM